MGVLRKRKFGYGWVNKKPDAHGGDANGDFGPIFYSVHLTDFGHLVPTGTISDCKASGSVWSDAVYVPNQQLHHTATSKTHDEHTDAYLNGELEEQDDADDNDGQGNNNFGILPTDPNQSPSPGESYAVRLITDAPIPKYTGMSKHHGRQVIPFLIKNVSLLSHILPDCAVPRFISKQPVMREKLIEMVLLRNKCSNILR